MTTPPPAEPAPEAAAETPAAAEIPAAAETPAAEAPAAEAPAAEAPSTNIVAGPGGVMTDEVGVVTGELTLRTDAADGQVVVRVQYLEADEWYTVTGTKTALADPAGAAAIQTIVAGILNRPEG